MLNPLKSELKLVAYDEAFSFYYPASLAALEEKGPSSIILALLMI